MEVSEIIILLCMIFLHIVDDYYMQGILASMKQKAWWKEKYPETLYKYDYLIALVEHAFSWTFSIHIPLVVWMILKNINISTISFVAIFIVNWFIHGFVDDLKANKLKINLVCDQVIHIIQIIITWLIYLNIIGNLTAI